MLKGNTLTDLLPQIWPILAFMTVVILIGLRFYKRTLD
jgi:ABC-2 type transport system permease protein